MPPDLHAVAAERLRRRDERYTRQRRTLIEVLGRAAAPMSVPELLTHDPDLAQSSAYRNLAVLERAGVVHRVTSTDEWGRFELAEDLTEHHHHHLICRDCGAVADFTVSEELERRLDAALTHEAERVGFVGDHHRLDLVGRCAACS